ncbi:MAG: alpha/beta hydrolase [Acidimicrobiales bacterium]
MTRLSRQALFVAPEPTTGSPPEPSPSRPAAASTPARRPPAGPETGSSLRRRPVPPLPPAPGRLRLRWWRVIVGTILAALIAVTGPASVSAASDTDPTEPGPYAVDSATISRWDAFGFGGGAVFTPIAAPGLRPVVAISPGFSAPGRTLHWLGRHLAGHGYVVVVIDTLTLVDPPSSRSLQLLAALDHVTTRGPEPARSLADPDRRAVIGHSMGGGGALGAGAVRPSLDAVIALQPWALDWTWGNVTSPTLVIGADNDLTAPANVYALPFATTLGGEHAYLEIDAGHLVSISFDPNTARFSVWWLQRFLDDDQAAGTELCDGDHAYDKVLIWRDTCPF